MPIPSVSSSSSITNEIETNIKCKNVSNEITNIFNQSDLTNTMGTDVSSNDSTKQQVQLKKTKKKALLLHARREDDDKTVNLTEERLCPISISGLYAGSRYHGTQKCGPSSYEVNVELLVSGHFFLSSHCLNVNLLLLACGYERKYFKWLFKN